MNPARKIVTGSPSRMVGRVCCDWLQDAAIEHESMLERSFVLAALSLPRLLRIGHQPFQLDLEIGPDQRLGKYVPDFALQFEGGSTVIVEVKPAVFLRKHAAKLKAAAQTINDRGHRFFVVTDLALQELGGVEAFELLRMRSRRVVSRVSAQGAIEILERHPEGLSISDICRRSGVSPASIDWLMGRGLVWCPKPFLADPTSVVFPLSALENSHVSLLVEGRFGAAPW